MLHGAAGYAAGNHWAWQCCCSSLLALHRTAVLRHDALGQETLMCLLLRNYLAYNLYDQVGLLVFVAYIWLALLCIQHM